MLDKDERDALHEIDPALPLAKVRTLDEAVDKARKMAAEAA